MSALKTGFNAVASSEIEDIIKILKSYDHLQLQSGPLVINQTSHVEYFKRLS